MTDLLGDEVAFMARNCLDEMQELDKAGRMQDD